MTDKDSKNSEPKNPSEDTARIPVPGEEAPAEESGDSGDTMRIDIGDSGSEKQDTARIDIDSSRLPEEERSDDTARIDIESAAEDSKLETDRIKLEDAKPTETARIDLEGAKQPKKSETDRIDLAAAHPVDESEELTSATMDPSAIEALHRAAAADQANRVDLSESDELPETEVSPEMAEHGTTPMDSLQAVDDDLLAKSTVSIDSLTQDAEDLDESGVPDKDDILMRSTVAIDSLTQDAEDLDESGVPDKDDILMRSTVAIDSLTQDAEDLDESGVPDKDDILMRSTVAIDIDAEPDDSAAPGSQQFDALKNQTMRVQLEDVVEAGKGDTARLADLEVADVSTPGATPAGTARVDLVEPADSEDVFKRVAPGTTVAGLAAGGAAAKAKKIKKPAVPAAPKNETARIEAPSASKGATARIEVAPEDIPHAPPRPKGIKLKRAEGAGKKPATSAAAPVSVLAEQESGDPVGLVGGIVGLLTLVMMGVLVYVLAAQSIAPDLPFPGRL